MYIMYTYNIVLYLSYRTSGVHWSIAMFIFIYTYRYREKGRERDRVR